MSLRAEKYDAVVAAIVSLLEDETDWVATLATTACELHHEFDHFDWTGFYRVVAPEMMVIGPYQGTHGCLRIPFSRGVCGAAARQKSTIIVPDVNQFVDHIACSSTTRSEIVVPVFSKAGDLLGVLDVDSNTIAAFNDDDRLGLERVCKLVGDRWAPGLAG